MTINCPHCAGALIVTGKRFGDRVLCTRCNGWSLLAIRADGLKYGVKVGPPPRIPRKVYQDDE